MFVGFQKETQGCSEACPEGERTTIHHIQMSVDNNIFVFSCFIFITSEQMYDSLLTSILQNKP